MRNDEENPKVGRAQYQRLVGTCKYLRLTRLDLANVVSIISRLMYDPRVEHLQGMDKILKQHQKEDYYSIEMKIYLWKCMQMLIM